MQRGLYGKRLCNAALRRGSSALAALAMLGACASAARAEPGQPRDDGGHRPTSLFPSRRERAAQLERDLARDLEGTLAAGPRVVGARVHLSLPTSAGLVGTIPARPGKAVVLVQHEGRDASWSERQVQELVAGGVQGLAPDQVRVVFQELHVPLAQREEASGAETWTTVGPIVVQQRSATLLRLVLGALSVSGLLLVGVVVALWWRLRPLLRDSRESL